jgi:large subunit ribosomal protein L9
MMKVFLREDVTKLGKAGEMVTVSDGYALNCLLPRKLAFIATPENERRVQAEAKRRAAKELERVASLKELAGLLSGRSVTINARANEEQKLFGSVGGEEVAEALKAEHGANVQPGHVVLETPIRELGVFDVKLRLADDIESEIKVWVVQQN